MKEEAKLSEKEWPEPREELVCALGEPFLYAGRGEKEVAGGEEKEPFSSIIITSATITRKGELVLKSSTLRV